MAMAILKRCVPVLMVLGAAFLGSCKRDVTYPSLAGPPGGPQFVLLAPGTVAQVSVGARTAVR